MIFDNFDVSKVICEIAIMVVPLVRPTFSFTFVP